MLNGPTLSIDNMSLIDVENIVDAVVGANVGDDILAVARSQHFDKNVADAKKIS